MSLTAAVCGFAVIVLAVSEGHSQNDWGVTYASTEICAAKGSAVEMRCSYTYPARINGRDTRVERTFWFVQLQEPVDLRAHSNYAGRVQYLCGDHSCTLRITDLRESDSALYKFKFITNQPGGRFVGSTGVALSVTGLQVQERKSSRCRVQSCTDSEMRCRSSCPPHHSSYIWFKNTDKPVENVFYSDYFYSEDSISCAIKGHEDFPSPSVCVYGDSCSRVTYTDRRICAFTGSSVNISCTHGLKNKYEPTFWFRLVRQEFTQPVDLKKNSQYADRVEVLEAWGKSTLRITGLRRSDSAGYCFKFTPKFEWTSSSPGTTLTVTDPDVQVQVIWSSTGPKLICHSSCYPPGHSSFVWYRNEERVREETSFSYGKYVGGADRYSCAYKGHRSPPVYAPKVPFVSVSPDGDIMKGNSVSLTCSSDASPAAKYAWYKKNQTLLREESQLVFSSIQPADSGEYYCTAENELREMTSRYVFIDVQYGPESCTVSVSPPGEVVEGSSVTLTCSSDANPAANYTWYKENQRLPAGSAGTHQFTSISAEDRGNYSCLSENQYRQINSTSLLLDVLYAPKLPSVSASPSAEVVEGSSVTLTCSSDANPAANYTWYKEDEESPKASEQNFTITDFRPEHSGNYYCRARNARGHRDSTSHRIVIAGAWKSAAMGTITAVLLAVALLAVFLWIRRYKCFTQQCKGGERPANTAQLNMGPVYDTPPAAAGRQPTEPEDDLQYSKICFPQNQADALYSNIGRAQPRRQTEEEEFVEYTAAKTDSSSGAPGTRRQENGEHLLALYSTVNKNST